MTGKASPTEQTKQKVPKPEQKREGIWLEIAEVRYEGGKEKACSVLLKADREQPERIWWPVEDTAVRDSAFETYKAILNELDKKRMVLARLACKCDSEVGAWLHCDSFRFQSPELGSR